MELSMKSARSLSKLLVSGAAVAALVTSCTIETKSSDGSTGGSSSGTTGGSSATTGGADATTGGTSSTTGGSSVATGGSSAATGGSRATTGGSVNAAGSGGDPSGGIGGEGASDAGGQGGASFDDCDACADAKCTAEFDACLDDPICITEDVNGTGQYEVIIDCMEKIRATRPLKRIDLRNCGTTVGTGSAWPPDGMAPTTLNLVNCIATGVTGDSMNNAWADNANISNPWAANSCAKLACTSQLP
jgi:hypothetical protein